jgi:hypothetical protein
MTKAPSSYKYEKITKQLFSLVCFLTLVYIFLVISTVKFTLDRQNAEKSISSLVASTSKLEFAYLEESSKISPSLSREMGFVDTRDIIVVKEGELLSYQR